MSKQETKDGENTAEHSAQTDISLDIENALSFIEAEEYENAAPKRPISVAEEKKPSAAKTLAGEPVPKQEDRALHGSELNEAQPIRRNQQPPSGKTATITAAPTSRNGSRIWILSAGVALLIVLAFIFLL